MQPIYFEGSHEIKKPEDMTDEECMSVWALEGIDYTGNKCFVTKWQPSYEDLQALNRGESIWIKILSNRFIPIAIWTIDENGECNDAG